jgi:membrane-bound serine protease (ClpP class)
MFIARWCMCAALMAAPAARAESPCVVAVDVDGVVHPVTVEILADASRQAANSGCALLLMRIDTPGGFLEATREATETILKSKPPVAAYVTPSGGRAASAGFFLLETADVAAMAPGTRTGAAHPVMLAGTPDDTLMKKVANDAAASLRAVVERRGRNVKTAESAVIDSKSFTDQEALKEGLIEFIARDEADLLRQISARPVRRFDGTQTQLNLAGARVIEYAPTLRQRVQKSLADPNLALAMLLLGALGVYIEFTTPGLIVPGVAGAILLLLGLASLAVLPLNWSGVALLLLAAALFILELKIASHGVLGVGATIALVLGAVLLIDSPVPETRIRLSTAITLAVPFAAIVIFLLSLIVKARLAPPQTGREAFPGGTATALTDLAPGGQVVFRGEVWQARSTRGVPAGSQVRVTGMDGLELKVEPGGD